MVTSLYPRFNEVERGVYWFHLVHLWLRLLGGWHFIAATAIKPPKAACQFAADDILLYEFCYYNPMGLLHHLEKDKEESSPLQNHHHYNTILSLYNIISRHYKKSLLISQIYHGYEELSTDTNYPIWRRQERRSKYVVQLASWQLRSYSPTCPSVRLWTESCLHCIFNNTCRINFIFAHLITQLQKVCHV